MSTTEKQSDECCLSPDAQALRDKLLSCLSFMNTEFEKKELEEKEPGFCIWEVDSNGAFKTSCQKDYFFTDDFTAAGIPDKFRLCPCCGRIIKGNMGGKSK